MGSFLSPKTLMFFSTYFGEFSTGKMSRLAGISDLTQFKSTAEVAEYNPVCGQSAHIGAMGSKEEPFPLCF